MVMSVLSMTSEELLVIRWIELRLPRELIPFSLQQQSVAIDEYRRCRRISKERQRIDKQ